MTKWGSSFFNKAPWDLIDAATFGGMNVMKEFTKSFISNIEVAQLCRTAIIGSTISSSWGSGGRPAIDTTKVTIKNLGFFGVSTNVFIIQDHSRW